MLMIEADTRWGVLSGFSTIKASVDNFTTYDENKKLW